MAPDIHLAQSECVVLRREIDASAPRAVAQVRPAEAAGPRGRSLSARHLLGVGGGGEGGEQALYSVVYLC